MLEPWRPPVWRFPSTGRKHVPACSRHTPIVIHIPANETLQPLHSPFPTSLPSTRPADAFDLWHFADRELAWTKGLMAFEALAASMQRTVSLVRPGHSAEISRALHGRHHSRTQAASPQPATTTTTTKTITTPEQVQSHHNRRQYAHLRLLLDNSSSGRIADTSSSSSSKEQHITTVTTTVVMRLIRSSDEYSPELQRDSSAKLQYVSERLIRKFRNNNLRGCRQPTSIATACHKRLPV